MFGAFSIERNTLMTKLRITILAISATMMCACGNNETKEIEQVAQNYLEAMGNYRIEEAVPFASSYTRENTLPALSSLVAIADTAYINSNRPAVITIHGNKKLSDSTARVYYHKSTPIKEMDDSINVLRENGHWLVDVRINPIPLPKKEDLQPQQPQFKADSVLMNGRYVALKDIKAVPLKK